jgi:putative transposase
VSENQAAYPIATMCRLLGVSPSGYYEWVKRRPSRRARANAELSEQIRIAHAGSRGTYGSPRVQAELAAQGIRAGRKRIARLMAESGLAGVSRRKFVTTTMKDGGRQAPDLVERDFTAERPDLLWVADITYIPTWGGFLYLAVVLDAFSRRIVGWSMSTSLATQLVLDALNMALAIRRPNDVIHHSDQGSQYTSIAFGHRCREAGVRPSMGSVGDAYDNAMCESFFATLECELLDRRRFKTQAEARMAAFEFIEGFYIAAAVIPRSVISRPSSTSDATTKAPSIPTHASVPSCLRPSRTSPSGGPKMGPFLTPAAHDGRIVVRVGTEEWRRRGPNKRMDQRRTKCRQIGYPDPNSATVHQIGAGPPLGCNRCRPRASA